MPYSPNRHARVFGSTFVKDYTEHPVIVIGADTWTRADLPKMGISQLKACSILTSCAKSIGAKSLKDLHANTSPYTFADFPAGVTTLYVLFACFNDRDLSIDDWYRGGREHALTTFLSLKLRELKARENERRDQKARQRKARRRTHEAAVAPLVRE